MTYKTYDLILQGNESTLENAREFAQCGAALSESEITEQEIKYARYEETINGIDIYYDYGADYYFFSPGEE